MCRFWKTSQRPKVAHVVFCTFWPGNMLRVTTAYTFSTSQLPEVVWGGQFSFLISKRASRRSGMCTFSISTSKMVRHRHFERFWFGNVLRITMACNFSSIVWPYGWSPAALARLLVEPLEPQIIEKHSLSRLYYLFVHLHLLSSDFSFLIFFPLTFCSLIFFLLTFSSLILIFLLFSSLTLAISAFHLRTLS